MPPSPKPSRKTADLAAALRNAGVRLTRPRKIILEILAARADRHPDAMEIFRQAIKKDSRISLPTVYRTLKMLEDLGHIQRHAFSDGRSRYERTDKPHHDHLIDMETGDVIEFRSDQIEALQARIARELGYEIVHHRLELYGRRLKKSAKRGAKTRHT